MLLQPGTVAHGNPGSLASAGAGLQREVQLRRVIQQAVFQQASVLKLMPMNNATQITEDERTLIKRWFEAGAPTAP